MSIHQALFRIVNWYDQQPTCINHLAKLNNTHILTWSITYVSSVLYTDEYRQLAWTQSDLTHSLKESLNSKW